MFKRADKTIGLIESLVTKLEGLNKRIDRLIWVLIAAYGLTWLGDVDIKQPQPLNPLRYAIYGEIKSVQPIRRYK